MRGDAGGDVVYRQISQDKSTRRYNKVLAKDRLTTKKGLHHTYSMTLQKCITE